MSRIEALIAAGLAVVFVSSPVLVHGQEQPAEKPVAEKNRVDGERKIPQFKLPEGSLSDQLNYLNEELEKGPRASISMRDLLSQLTPLSEELTTKLLATKGNEAAVLRAVELRMQLLQLSQRYRVTKTREEAEAFVASLKNDKRPGIVKFVYYHELSARVDGVLRATAEERAGVADAVVKYVRQAKEISMPEVRIARNAVRMLGYTRDYELAARTGDTLGELIAKSDNEDFARAGRYMVGTARRYRLPGNQIKLEGKTHDGKDFDWSTYRGKIVLVDFWATWCGPCLRELPTVLANYEKYHGKGFDVVGISIDDDLSRLQKFLDRRKLPWINLHDSADDNPNAAYYGVSAIPSTMLVGKDGKVLELNVRGLRLGQLLEKHLGPVEDTQTTREGSGE